MHVDVKKWSSICACTDAPHRDHYFHRDTVDRAPSSPRQRRPSGRRRQDAVAASSTPGDVAAAPRSTVPSHWSDTLNLAAMPTSSTPRHVDVTAAVAVCSLAALLLPAAAAVA